MIKRKSLVFVTLGRFEDGVVPPVDGNRVLVARNFDMIVGKGGR